MSKVLEKKTRYQQLQRKKQPFEQLYKLIARYIDMREVSFTDGRHETSTIIPTDITNNDASHISESASSALLGALWPNGADSFVLEKHRTIENVDEVKNWFKMLVNPGMYDAMDKPHAGLQTALEETITELINYGVGSVFSVENANDNLPVSYTCWDVKSNFIDEDQRNFVDVLYRWKMMDVRTVVAEYGIENVSPETRKQYKDGMYDEKVYVLVTIEPRADSQQEGLGILGMPIETMHIEYDQDHILKEGGFAEFPVPTARYKKKPDEVWGRGSGGQAMPEIIELNTVYEATTAAYERWLDPALGVMDDGSLGGGVIDTSPGGTTVFTVNQLTGVTPVFPMYNVGEPNAVIPLIQQLTQSISQHYMLDRLLDLNNQTEMTLGEANIRNSLRSDSLRKIYARLTAELFVPLINRTFNILLRRGFFGHIRGSDEANALEAMGVPVTYIPEAIADYIQRGRDFYEIKFKSPAARMLQMEETSGIMQLLEVATTAGQAFPHALDSFNIDEMLKKLAVNLGISIDVLNSTEVIQTIREARAEANQMAAQVEQEKAMSEVNRNNAQAQSTMNKGYV